MKHQITLFTVASLVAWTPVSWAKTTAAEDDWVPRENLTAKQQERVPIYCTGAYIEPQRPGINTVATNESPVSIRSDLGSVRYESISGVTDFDGGVILHQGDRQIEADDLSYNVSSGAAEAKGHLKVRQRNLYLKGDRIRLYNETGEIAVEQPDFLLHEFSARGDARGIQRLADGRIRIMDVMFTTCPMDDQAWSLLSDQMILDFEEGVGKARHSRLEMWDIPVAYTPYFEFPLDDRRKTGLLYPSAGLGSETGLDITQPIYLNLAPNFDATLYPRFMSSRGLLTEGEFRFMGTHGFGHITAGGMQKDRYKDDTNPFYDEQRWYTDLGYNHQFNSNWSYDLLYQRASDYEYFNDFTPNAETTTDSSILDQKGTLRYKNSSANHRISASLTGETRQSLQVKSDLPYERQPEFLLEGAYTQPDMNNSIAGLVFDYNLIYTNYYRDEDFKYKTTEYFPCPGDPNQQCPDYIYSEEADGLDKAVGDRVTSEVALSWPLQAVWGRLTPRTNLRGTAYSLERLDREDFDNDPFIEYDPEPNMAAYGFSLDGELYFERPFTFNEQPFIHTFEPRAKYLWNSHAEDQLQNPDFDSSERSFSASLIWANDRFTGNDRFGDANQLSYGFTSRLLSEGVQYGSVSMAQIRYFQNRRVTLSPIPDNEEDTDVSEIRRRYLRDLTTNRSPIATAASITPLEGLSVAASYIWDPVDRESDEGTLGIQYLPTDRQQFSLTYRFKNSVEDRYLRDDVDGAAYYVCVNGKVVENVNDCALPENGNSTNKLVSNDASVLTAGAYYGVSSQWSLLAGYSYDLTNKLPLSWVAGVQYDACCWMTRLVYEEALDTSEVIDVAQMEYAVYFEFVLRGMSSLTGNSAGRVMETYIPGFKAK